MAREWQVDGNRRNAVGRAAMRKRDHQVSIY